MSMLRVFLISLLYSSSASAADYDSIRITPEKVGLLYNATNNPDKAQQFTAWGVKAGQPDVDITDEVDWYIEPNGYPLNGQPEDHVAAEIDVDTGLATAVSDWGRVVVHACYPKGCFTCSDGTCAANEGCSSCPQDCGECSICSDGTCAADEDCSSCPQDCGECSSCSDGICAADEDCSSCPADCGQCDGCTDGGCAGDTDESGGSDNDSASSRAVTGSCAAAPASDPLRALVLMLAALLMGGIKRRARE